MGITINDAHVLLNMIAEQATGEKQQTPVDTKSFASLGSKIMEQGTDNVINALSIVMGRLFVAVRPYNEKLTVFNEFNTNAFTSRIRKISYYNEGMQASGMYNTTLNPNNIKNGSENVSGEGAVGSMWEQNLPKALEVNFYSSNVWDTSMTVLETQLKNAFRSEEEFIEFWNGRRVQKQNEIALANESFRRAMLLNSMAGRYSASKNVPEMSSLAVNLTEEFNKKFGTTYTSKELRTTHLKEFLAFMVSTIKQYSRKMSTNSAMYHNDAKNSEDDKILRHTPKNLQKLLLFNPLIIDAEASVLPEIFNDNYLSLDNYEAIDFWQTFNDDIEKDALISVNCKYNDQTLTAKDATVNGLYVVGYMFDKDALVTNTQIDNVYTTPIEARKGYRNLWWHFRRGVVDDNTENGILFYMEDAQSLAKTAKK